MNILFTARASLFAQPGGDTQQIVQTADALRERGILVDIKLRGEYIDLAKYDLVHFFNAGRPADIMHLLPKIKVPLVVSSIWVDYSEWDAQQKGAKGMLYWMLGNDRFEYMKSIARGLNATDQFPGIGYIRSGQKASMKKLLMRANVVIASSASEANRLDKSFGIGNKTEVIPLGLNPLVNNAPEPVERSGVICVGRIEGLKNQLNLIRAAKGASWQLKIIGKSALNQPDYYAQCVEEAGVNVTFEGWLTPEHLSEAYRQAKVLVLPSYFETFGLVALEAMANGCNLVLANRPDMNDIFKGIARFCNPDKPEDIRLKIEESLIETPRKPSAEDLSNYSWQNHASTLLRTYQACYAQMRTANL